PSAHRRRIGLHYARDAGYSFAGPLYSQDVSAAAARNAAEREAFAGISGALVEIAIDRAQFAGTVEPGDGRAVGAHDLALLVASRAALGVEHRGRELDRVKRLVGDRRHHQGAAEIRVVFCVTIGFQRPTASVSVVGSLPSTEAREERLSAVL